MGRRRWRIRHGAIGDEETQAEVGAVAESKGALDFLVKLDGEGSRLITPSAAIGTGAAGLILEAAQGSSAWQADLSVLLCLYGSASRIGLK